jgi:hypothetical protein
MRNFYIINSSVFQLPALCLSPQISLLHIISNLSAASTARCTAALDYNCGSLLEFPNSVRAECGRQTAFDECGLELQYNSQRYSELSVAAFCWHKMLIGAIRGEIWSLFNTERRISEIERRGGWGKEKQN